MAKGDRFVERVRYEDELTGASGWQLTSFPTHSMTLGYSANQFTPDGGTVLFVSQRAPSRDAPWDLFRAGLDGLSTVQLTAGESARGVVMAPDGGAALYNCTGTLYRVDLEEGKEEQVSRCELVAQVTGGVGFLSHDGAYYFVRARLVTGEDAVVRYGLDGSQPRVIRKGAEVGINCVDYGGAGIAAVVVREGEEVYIQYDYDGVGERYLGPNCFAHSSWLFGRGVIQGCARMPDRGVLLMAAGERPEFLVGGQYFWHSGSSYDGGWIVADTNWPREGLWLISVAKRRAVLLCRPPYTGGHPQWGHPHPCFSPDGRSVLFNGDPHGVGQVFVVTIPEAVRAEGLV